MRRLTLTGNCDIADPNGIAAGVTGATFTLVTTTIATDSLAHKLTMLNNSVTDHSGKDIVISGEYHGKTIGETISAPAGSATVTTALFYTKINSAVPSASIGADTFDIGWAVDARSNWFHVGQNPQDANFSIDFYCAILSGSPTYTVEHTYGDSLDIALPHATINGATANQEGGYTKKIQAIRLAWSAAGEVELKGSWIN